MALSKRNAARCKRNAARCRRVYKRENKAYYDLLSAFKGEREEVFKDALLVWRDAQHERDKVRFEVGYAQYWKVIKDVRD